MPQIGGKNAKKSSKTKSKSSSTSKRHFTVVIGTKEHGLYCSSSPSSAARKAVSKLCGKEKGKKVEFCLREITQGSKKKTYGPYLGHIEKLAKPIQLKGRLVERKPVALLKAKSSAKKGGMRGGEEMPKNMKNFMNLFKLLRQKNKFSNERKQIRFDDKYEFLNELSDDDLITLLTITHTTFSHLNKNNEIFNEIMNDKSKNSSFKREHQDQIRKVIRIRAEILEYMKNHNND
jgi:hypothetical protein